MADETAATPLERAMRLYFAAVDSGSDLGGLADQHPDLRELLEPMVAGGGSATCGEVEGATIGGCRLLRELGRGGMGIVYEAWEAALDRKVAVKVIAPALVADASAVARFRREAAAAARLRHAGIVEVLQFGVDAGRHFFVMEFVDGPSLQACREQFREPTAAVAMARQVLDALQHAHEHGLVHRDVKPANILIRADGSAVVSDFGLASDATLPSLTRAGAFLGTLDYASPEQVRGEPVDARTDVFAVGVVLHELLAGSHPFRDATQESTMRRLLTHEPLPLQRVDPRIPRDLAAIVSSALRKDRQRRYATAAAMAADLVAVQQGNRVSVRLPSAPERLWRWIRREPWRAAAAVLLGLGALLLAGGAGYWAAIAPDLAAGASARAAHGRNELLTEAWLVYEEDPSAALQLLAGHGELAADGEAVLLQGLAWQRLARPAEAAAVLRTFDSPAFQRLVSGSATGDADAEADAVAAGDPFQALVAGIVTYSSGVDIGTPDLYRRATAHLHRAVLLSGTPRAVPLIYLLRAAARAGDSNMVALAKAALELHFPDLRNTKRAIANATVLSDPKAALSLVLALESESPAGAARAPWAFCAGTCYRALNQPAEAEAAYRRCVEASPTHAQGWNHLGMLLRSTGRMTNAIAAYERSIEATPTYARAWYNLGNAHLQQRDMEAAERVYRRAIELQPLYALPHNGLGRVYLDLARFDDAAAAFERAIALDPQLSDALTNLGLAYMSRGRSAEALPFAERAVRMRPKHPDYLRNLALAAIEVGRTEIARTTTAELVAVAAKSSKAWCTRAWALLLDPSEVVEAVGAAAHAIEFADAGQLASAYAVAAAAAMAAGDVAGARERLGQFDASREDTEAWDAAKVDVVRSWLQGR